MKRRVIKQGNATLTVTLPHSWVKENGITPKDELEVLDQEGSLLIRGPGAHAEKDTSLDLRGMPVPAIWRTIISCYRAGFTELTLRYDEGGKEVYSAFSYDTLKYLPQRKERMSPLEAIQALVNRLIGVEIIDQHEGRCVIKELVEPSPKEFQNSLRRIFLIILTMAEESAEAVKGEKRGVKSVHISDTNLDRFEDFCIRLLNPPRMSPRHVSHALHTLVFLLEMIGDEYKRLAIHLVEGPPPSKAFARLLGMVNEEMKETYEIYYRHSVEAASDLMRKDDSLQQALDRHHEKHGEQELLHHLKKISRFATSVNELCLDLHVGKDFEP